MESVRRSKRERKQVHSIYEDAEKEKELREENSPRKKRRSNEQKATVEKDDTDQSDRDDEEEEKSTVSEVEEEQDENDDQPDQDEEEEEEEEEESDDDEEEEEEYTPRTAAKMKSRTTASVFTKRSSPPKRTKQLSPRNKPSLPKKKAPRRALNAALTSLSKKLLHEDESPTNSLLSALLNSSKRDPNSDSEAVSALRKIVRGKESPYTANLVATAKTLFDEHHQDPNAVHVSLYNLLFRSVGAKFESLLDPAEVDLENLSDGELSEHMRIIYNSMEETPVEHVPLMADIPASSKGQSASREYLNIYREFWYLLGVTSLSDTLSGNQRSKKDERDRDEPVNDSQMEQGFRFQIEMIREILRRMIEMTCLVQVDLRLGSVISVYELAVAILERTVELREKLRVSQRQLNVARKNNMKRKAEALGAQNELWNRMCSELEELVSETVVGIFMKRYKDVNPTIRAESMRTISRFILTRPDIFMKQSFLKYMGWMLSDKAVVVRLAALEGLLAPFKANREASSRNKRTSSQQKIDTSCMTGIAVRFAPRLSECALDVDVAVQEKALDCMLEFSRHGYLDDISDQEIWKRINDRALASDTSPTVRHTALVFVLEQLEAFDSEVMHSEAGVVARITALASWITHRISANNIPFEKLPYDSVGHVVSSLRCIPEHASLLFEYSAMLQSLKACGQEAASQGQRNVDAVQRRVLLEIIVASIGQEMSEFGDGTLEVVVDPALLAAHRVEAPSSREMKAQRRKGLQEKFTVATLQALPELFSSFRTDAGVLRGLTALPKYFLASVLNTSQQKKLFTKLLNQLSSLFRTSEDAQVLFNCCLTLTFLAKGDHTRSSESLVCLKELTVSICDQLMSTLKEKSAIDNPMEQLNVQLSISSCLQRLSLLTKRWPLSKLLPDGMNGTEKLCSVVSASLASDLKIRKLVSDSEDMHGIELIPEIWETAPKQLHGHVRESVLAGLSFLLQSLAWRLQEQLDMEGEERQNTTAFVAMRDSLMRLLCHSFEIHVDEESDSYSRHHKDFARSVQSHAAAVAGDLRSLLHREWMNSSDPVLRDCALTNDSHMIGGSMRFLQCQERKLRVGEGNNDVARALLLPTARCLCRNWKQGNRREAGLLLTHITGSGTEASTIISSMSRVMKKVEPVRFLEAHMACLRQAFEEWATSEPEEPQSQHASVEEIEEFEQAEKDHRAKFELLEQQAKRLSSSLGVGKLSDASLKPVLVGFVREGVRFAFSTDDPHGGEPLYLGARLPFLAVLSKYLSWIRKDRKDVELLRKYFNEKEVELRNHPDYLELGELDKKSLSVFRQSGNLGTFLVEDDDEKSRDDSLAVSLNQSLNSSSRRGRLQTQKKRFKKLSPLLEGNEEDDEDDGNDGNGMDLCSTIEEGSHEDSKGGTEINESRSHNPEPSPTQSTFGEESSVHST